MKNVPVLMLFYSWLSLGKEKAVVTVPANAEVHRSAWEQNRESPALHSCANPKLWKPHMAATRSHFSEPAASGSSSEQAFPWCAVLTPLWVWHLQLRLGCQTQWALVTMGNQLKPSRSGYKPYSVHRESSPFPGALRPLSCPRVNAAFRLNANGGEGGSWRAGVLPCHPGPYRQRFPREISLLNQLLHQTPGEQ